MGVIEHPHGVTRIFKNRIKEFPTRVDWSVAAGLRPFNRLSGHRDAKQVIGSCDFDPGTLALRACSLTYGREQANQHYSSNNMTHKTRPSTRLFYRPNRIPALLQSAPSQIHQAEESVLQAHH